MCERQTRIISIKKNVIKLQSLSGRIDFVPGTCYLKIYTHKTDCGVAVGGEGGDSVECIKISAGRRK